MSRIVDVFIASFLLIVLSPLILCISVLVRLNMGSNIVFRQLRIGKHGIPFYIYKFRSMNEAVSVNGLLPDQMRLTSFGSLLRKYSLDELPQLWNVLKGDISLIGPRPLLPEYMPLYSERQARRHEVKPGITGWAQVNGRNSLSWEEKFELDIWYVDNRTNKVDLLIIWLTIKNVLLSKDISQEGSATMEKFRGN